MPIIIIITIDTVTTSITPGIRVINQCMYVPGSTLWLWLSKTDSRY